jgi:inhibitor of cysteine peptidase
MKSSNWPLRVLILLIAFCSSSPDVMLFKQPLNPVWAETSHPDLKLTEKNSGNTVKVIAGQLIEVRLLSNATTGYEWIVTKQDEQFLEIVGKPTFVPPNRDGGTGQQVFLFRARKAGLTELTLIYSRPFETDKPPLRLFNVTVEIR